MGTPLIWVLVIIAMGTGWLAGGRALALVLGAVVALGAFGWLQRTSADQVPNPVKVGPDSTYATSVTCRGCHPKEWHSWSKSFHRTMTQLPTPQSVLADFNITLKGVTGQWRLYRDNAQYKAEHTPPSGETKTALVSLLTGSHHMQNFWLSIGDGWLIQLPWVWWIKKKRWIPVEASFLRPAPTGPEAPAVWNDECVYCHTTQGTRGARRDATRAESQARELGIGCESCHGPGLEHIEHYRNPVNRYLGWLSRPNTDILSALESKGETTAICAQCHGLFAHLKSEERDRIGDPHRPGDILSETRHFLRLKPAPRIGQKPMLPAEKPYETTLRVTGQESRIKILGMAPDGFHVEGGPRVPGQGGLALGSHRIIGRWAPTEFGGFLAIQRWPTSAWRGALDALGYPGVDFRPYDWHAFWDDGTMRTAGRAFNGMADSACAIEGNLNCGSCHTMHGEQPNDQLKPGHRGNEACVACHQAYVDNPTAHTHHGSDSSGSQCQNCHMPHTTYGLLGASRAHRIDVPRPAAMEARNRPNACNLCHLDRSVHWAQNAVDEWYGHESQGKEMLSPKSNLAAAFDWLLTGDGAIRAIATWHLGWKPARDTSQIEKWIDPVLPILALDEYAAVRAIFEQILPTLRPDAVYDFTQPSPVIFQGTKGRRFNGQTQRVGPTVHDVPSLTPLQIKDLLHLRDHRSVYISE